MKEIEEIRVEAKALETALAVVDGQEDPEKARDYAAVYQQMFRQPKTPEGYAIATSIRKICGQPMLLDDPKAFRDAEDSWVDRATGIACISWVTWALNEQKSSGLFTIEHLKKEIPNVEVVEGLVLSYWGSAIEALLVGEPERARQFYRRATTLGAEYGTQSNPVIQWTYAASFFPVVAVAPKDVLLS